MTDALARESKFFVREVFNNIKSNTPVLPTSTYKRYKETDQNQRKVALKGCERFIDSNVFDDCLQKFL